MPHPTFFVNDSSVIIENHCHGCQTKNGAGKGAAVFLPLDFLLLVKEIPHHIEFLGQESNDEGKLVEQYSGDQ
jgi:hypothetical protein